MKKISLIIFALTVIFSSCKKDDPKPNLRMTNEVERDTALSYKTWNSEGYIYQITWKVYSDEAKKNLIAYIEPSEFEGTNEDKKWYFPMVGGGNIKVEGVSYWRELNVKRKRIDGTIWETVSNGLMEVSGFGWWDNDDYVYTNINSLD